MVSDPLMRIPGGVYEKALKRQAQYLSSGQRKSLFDCLVEVCDGKDPRRFRL